MQISACFITKNEEKNIEKAICSLQGMYDELIVTDTGSEDRTVEIAEKYGARVYNFKWQNDFSLARNFTIDKAGGDWIIFLDADEYFIGKYDIRDYLEKIEKLHPKTEALLLPLPLAVSPACLRRLRCFCPCRMPSAWHASGGPLSLPPKKAAKETAKGDLFRGGPLWDPSPTAKGGPAAAVPPIGSPFRGRGPYGGRRTKDGGRRTGDGGRGTGDTDCHVAASGSSQ